MTQTSAPGPREAPRSAHSARRLPAGWPLIALFVGYPLWWALGLGALAFWIFAVPMAAELVRRHRSTPGGLRLPPGSWAWALFLVWAALGVTLVGLTPEGMLPGGASPLGALFRVGSYLAVTVLLLYVGNLSRSELPDGRIAALLGWLGIVTVAGGLLGTFAPAFAFTSPVELLLPEPLPEGSYVQALLHPASAQIMEVLGYESPRPAAPWEYTNSWGNNLSLLLIWLVVGWICLGATAQRWVAGAALALAAVPAVYSLNRGLWIGVGLSLAFLLYHLVRHRRLFTAALCSLLAAGAASAVLLSPLADILSARAENPHSNPGRAAASISAIEAANSSPVVGWGSTRDALGSNASIAIGTSPDCPQCGNPTIGNNGQLWLLLISHGWAGTALFLFFFAAAVWRHRRDTSPVGLGALLTILLLFWYMFVYTALIAPLAITMIAVALLWRRAQAGSSEPTAPEVTR